ncbi:MAG TPA: hypothetical protein VK163_11720 [Opitutaceae bacterium]|nr:hypothetical protein [Opitutaceae bacterium]
MKALALFIFFAVIPLAVADLWAEAKPLAAASPTGRFVVRTTPGEGVGAIATVYELGADGTAYSKQREFRLLNRTSPVDICITDSAEVVTFDCWGSMGYEHAVVWYASNGTVKREYTLKEILPEKVLAEITAKHRSRSSINWRKAQPFFNGPALLIPDAVGGYVILGDDVIDYQAARN